MKASSSEIKDQTEFCRSLMYRLFYDVTTSEHIKTSVVKDDVRRLRRELNILSHMCEWDYKKG